MFVGIYILFERVFLFIGLVDIFYLLVGLDFLIDFCEILLSIFFVSVIFFYELLVTLIAFFYLLLMFLIFFIPLCEKELRNLLFTYNKILYSYNIYLYVFMRY
jgi:hypothetical protein